MKNPFRFPKKYSIDDLLTAIESEDRPLVEKILLKKPELINQKNAYGMSPLMYATLRGLKDLVDYFMEMGADLNMLHENESTPLMVAILEGQLDILQSFVKHPNLNLNMQDRFGASAAMYATKSHRADILKLLLEAGADPNQRDIEGETALMYAVGNKHKNLIQLLLKHGALKNLKNFDGLSAWDKAYDEEIQDLLKE